MNCSFIGAHLSFGFMEQSHALDNDHETCLVLVSWFQAFLIIDLFGININKLDNLTHCYMLYWKDTWFHVYKCRSTIVQVWVLITKWILTKLTKKIFLVGFCQIGIHQIAVSKLIIRLLRSHNSFELGHLHFNCVSSYKRIIKGYILVVVPSSMEDCESNRGLCSLKS